MKKMFDILKKEHNLFLAILEDAPPLNLSDAEMRVKCLLPSRVPL